MELGIEQWKSAASTLTSETRPLIEGKFDRSSSDELYDLINPANETPLASLSCGCADDVDRAVASARRAFSDGRWLRSGPQGRGEVLSRLVELMLANRNELALLDCLDVGKPITQALSEVEMACEYITFAAEVCDKIADETIPSPESLLVMSLREPVGVVGAILPWNFPMVVVALKLAPALAMGNCLVLKPSEISPRSALLIGRLALEAGVPDGVLNIVPGLGNTVGRALSGHMDVDMVTFTGSTATGKLIMKAAAETNLKKLMLECGGKSPQIVFADVGNLDDVAEDVVENITWNQGQVCVAGSRLLVEEPIRDALVDKIAERMGAMHFGDPLDPDTRAGPLASGDQISRVLGHIDAAKAEGACLKMGGQQDPRSGYFMHATIVDNVEKSMRIAQEEVFGPVLAVLPFTSIEDALTKANFTKFGLSARVWTSDMSRGYAMSRMIRAGEVTVNVAKPSGATVGVAAAAEPFGQSGFGAEGGIEGLKQYTRRKAIHFNLPSYPRGDPLEEERSN